MSETTARAGHETGRVIVVETQRLSLRQMTEQDDAFILHLLNEPSFLQYIGDRGVRTLDDAREYIRTRAIDSYHRLGHGLWAVEAKDSGVLMGICGIVKRESLADVDLGYAFLPQFWSKGYALESARAAVEYVVDVMKVRRLLAITSLDNERSISVLEKLGFHFDTTFLSEEGEELRLFVLET